MGGGLESHCIGRVCGADVAVHGNIRNSQWLAASCMTDVYFLAGVLFLFATTVSRMALALDLKSMSSMSAAFSPKESS